MTGYVASRLDSPKDRVILHAGRDPLQPRRGTHLVRRIRPLRPTARYAHAGPSPSARSSAAEVTRSRRSACTVNPRAGTTARRAALAWLVRSAESPSRRKFDAVATRGTTSIIHIHMCTRSDDHAAAVRRAHAPTEKIGDKPSRDACAWPAS